MIDTQNVHKKELLKTITDKFLPEKKQFIFFNLKIIIIIINLAVVRLVVTGFRTINNHISRYKNGF